ncbi:FMN-binding negative transcriptional regulator [Pedobacter roseus]|jgi:transcriptional regulator|uniref:FMN-binding negative transcriptional regulator n=1 Tax=Pedobacter roseus TaxID=336820 RepID=A0A7G9QEU7_9SPHI|nr:FMN-binding negative transcriptional regulator [Pedobacter roseus]QNN41872.1 FMN-binding negative transcriptional regulator [Pedobacter roseus]
MYKLPHFTANNQDEILEFMHQNTFVTLIGFDGEYPVATQVPVKTVIDGESIKLIGHVMTKTDHCKAFEQNPNVMAIFTGAHAYISASVYEKPASVSTWNYKTVQAKGIIRLMSPEETYQAIKELTNKYEDPETSPAAFNKMDEDYIQKHLKAITGFEVLVKHIDHVFKMSQNHSAKNQESIVANLEKSDDIFAKEVAKEMNKNL